MVDNNVMTRTLMKKLEPLFPAELKDLTPAQQVEVTNYLVDRIAASDELLGAVTRKVQSLSRKMAKASSRSGSSKA